MGQENTDTELLIAPDEERLEALEGQIRELRAQARYAEAVPLAEEIVEINRGVHGEDHWQSKDALRELETIRRIAAMPPEAQQELAETEDIGSTVQHLYNAGRFDEALRLARQELAAYRSRLGPDHPNTLGSIGLMADLLTSMGRLLEAEPYCREALEGRRRVLGSEHPDALTSINNMGMLLQSLGKLSEAEPYLREALEELRRVLGDQHPVTLNSINNMGFLLQSLGKPSEAELYLREALEGLRRVLGDQHPDTLNSINNMGSLLARMGKLSEAQSCVREALEGLRRVLGDQHPITLTTTNNMGSLLASMGKLLDAEPYYHEALEGRRRLLGNEHPQTLESINGMGYLLGSMDRLSDAEPYLREALDGRQRVLGDRHPDTLTSMNNMGFLLQSLGKVSEAEPYYCEALRGRRRVLGSQHPDTLNSMNNMGSLLESLGKLSEAEPYFREALEGHRRVLGDQHPDTLNSINNMGVLLQSMGRLGAAEPYYREALEGCRRVLGDQHPETLTAVNNMGSLLASMGRLSDSERYYREALEGRRRVCGDQHASTLESINNVGHVLLRMGRLSDAEPYSRDAMERSRHTFGDQHRNTLTVIYNMGSLLELMGKLAEAESYYGEALEGRRRVLGDEHPDTLNSINNMGGLLVSMGKLAEAESYYGEALQGRRRVLGDEHPDTLTSINNMGGLLVLMGKLAEAEPYCRRALEGSRRVLGDEHPDTLMAVNNMGGLLHRMGNLAEVELYYRSALDGGRHVLGEGDRRTLRWINNLGRLIYAEDRVAEAESLLLEAAAAFETARVQMTSAPLDRALASTSLDSPFALLSVCRARLGLRRRAWQSLERHHARALFDEISGRELRPLEESERAAENQTLASLTRLDEELAALRASNTSEEDAEQPTRELRQKREALQSRLAEFLKKLDEKYGAAVGNPYALEDIQKQIPARSAIVAWLDLTDLMSSGGGDHWACIVRKHGEPVWVELKAPEHGDSSTRLRRLLSDRSSSLPDLAQLIAALCAERIVPLAPHLAGIEHLVVLPTGWAGGIPLEVLMPEYVVSYAPSGTMYAWLRQKPSPPQGGNLLALGDPQFAPAKPSGPGPSPPEHGVLLATVAADSNATRGGLRQNDVLLAYNGQELRTSADLGPAIAAASAASPIPIRAWREGEILELVVQPGKLGVGLSKQPAGEVLRAGQRLDQMLAMSRSAPADPLPGTRSEAEALRQLFSKAAGSSQPLVLLGSDASEPRLDELASNGRLGEFRYLHFATHAVPDDGVPLHSALILAQAPEPSDVLSRALAGHEIYDGRLTAGQIVRTWKLDADVVTLSACETALGQRMGGEGYLGFAQALFVAGARSLVLSLWKVDDTATALLMTRFYENLLGAFDETRQLRARAYVPGAPLPKALALQEAKQWLRSLTREQAEAERRRLGLPVEQVVEQRGLSSGTDHAGELDPANYLPFAHPYYWAAFILLGDSG